MKLIDRIIWIMGITGVVLLVGALALSAQWAHVLEVRPDVARPGDTVELRVRRPPSIWGLGWTVEKRGTSGWEEFGYTIAGPGEQWSPGVIEQVSGSVVVPLIGFGGSATLPLAVHENVPAGDYRIGQSFTPDGPGSYQERREWHWAEFQVRN